MHITGKILLGLVFLGSFPALFLVTRFLDIRNHWVQEVVKVEEQSEKLKVQVKDKENELRAIRKEIASLKIEQDSSWERNSAGVPIGMQVVDPNNGIIRAPSFGFRSGFASPDVQELPVAYLFSVNPDQSSRFLGAFKTTTLQETMSEFKLVRKPLVNQNPNEYQWNPAITSRSWPATGNFRVRTRIPVAYQTVYDDMTMQLDHAKHQHTKLTGIYTNQTQLLTTVREQRDQRIAELLGDAYLPPDKQMTPEEKAALPQLTKGYLKAVEEADIARNQVYLEIDDLRRHIKAAQDEIERLRQENDELVRQTPTPENPSIPPNSRQVSTTDAAPANP